MRALMMLALIVATVGYGVERMGADPVTSASCVGVAHAPIDPTSCLPDPQSPSVDDLSDDDVNLPAVAACDNVQLRVEDAYADGLGGGAALTCP